MRLARLSDRTLVRNLLLTAAIAVVLLVVSLAITPFNNLRLARSPTTSRRWRGSPCSPASTARSRSAMAR